MKEQQMSLIQDQKPMTAFSSPQGFEAAQRMALALTSSDLVPTEYRGKEHLGNAMIALEISQRLNASPLMVMQNLYIVHNRPAWSAQFIISAINASGRFSPLRFEMSGDKSSRACYAWVLEKDSGERLEGPSVSMKMAMDEGWLNRKGSKWQTMPEVMLRYRAASFFGRLYAPDILMGMQTEEEVHDVYDAKPVETIDTTTGEVIETYETRVDSVAAKVAKAAGKESAPVAAPSASFTLAELSAMINSAVGDDALDQLEDLANSLPAAEQKVFSVMLQARR